MLITLPTLTPLGSTRERGSLGKVGVSLETLTNTSSLGHRIRLNSSGVGPSDIPPLPVWMRIIKGQQLPKGERELGENLPLI